MSRLALYGGEPVRRLPMPPRPPYGILERNAANTVLASGNLSGFLGTPGESFLGGERVRRLEEAFCERFGVRYAVSMNSATSCLFGAVQALGIGPGDEVIVPPWSMSASVACVRAAGAVPVFADVELDTYGLDAAAVAEAVTPRTKGIVLVDLFGCPPRDLAEIRSYGIPVVEDAAQAIGAIAYLPGRSGGRPGGQNFFAGTVGMIGVYSLNRHKTIECGEGGIAVTDDDETADFLRGYRNHGEVLNYRQGYVGGNYRLGEVYAAVAEVQLERLDELTLPRIRNAERLTAALAEMDGVVPPSVPPNSRHVYYLYAVQVEGSAERWAEALVAEGIQTSPQERPGTYVEPLYRIPAYKGYGRRDDSNDWEGWYLCVEDAYRHVLVIPHVHAGTSDADLDDVVRAFEKVYEHQGDL